MPSTRDVTPIIDAAEDEVVQLASASQAPGAIALVRMRMLRSIARLHGLGPRDEFLVSLGDSLAQGLAARTLTEKMGRWMPVVGRLVDALAEARMTHELGWAAHEHFLAMDPAALKALRPPPVKERPRFGADSLPPVLPDGSPNPMLVSGYGPSWTGLDELERRVAAHPDDDDLLALLGFVYYTGGQWPRAIEHYERAIRINDASPSHHYYLGNAHFRAGQFVPARDQWERVVELDPAGRLGANAKRRAASLKKLKA